ncbi:hypothetical protein GCM10011247_26040 [Pseudomonas plecoglossicida]|nr:hypothetical protein GCM10011247_26040 [Pseudomonas plecoglossicida]
MGNPAFGGMGMPKMLGVLFEEMLYAADCSFSLYSALSAGRCLAIDAHASESLKATYLPALYEGRWAGTMCLTEPHAGTDLGLIRTRAEPQADGSFHISGSKIFITGGEQDLTENIVHLVLAKLPDAPAGAKGISLFLVPKFRVAADGSLGPRNAVHCGSIEHKMGIKASATCVMNFDGATGYLVGEGNKGLAAMFTMMNYERLSIGIQGIGCAEASYQSAARYANERLQSRAAVGPQAQDKGADPIIHHGDVRRMLLTMRALTEGGRAFAAYVGQQLDLSRYAEDTGEREHAQRLVALLTPVAKAFFTDNGLESCVLGQQVFGGHGYIREWGQEQRVRDVRIAQIYEGTNGIQALDLLGRKVLADGGQGLASFAAEVRPFCVSAPLHRDALQASLVRLVATSEWLSAQVREDANLISSVAVEYLHLFRPDGVRLHVGTHGGGGPGQARRRSDVPRRQAGHNRVLLPACAASRPGTGSEHSRWQCEPLSHGARTVLIPSSPASRRPQGRFASGPFVGAGLPAMRPVHPPRKVLKRRRSIAHRRNIYITDSHSPLARFSGAPRRG